MNYLRKYITSVFLLFISFFSIASIVNAEETVKVSKSVYEKLVQLNQKLTKLNEELNKTLNISNEELSQTQTELENCKAELQDIKTELANAQTDTETYKVEMAKNQQLLIETNQKLENYQKNIEKKVKWLTCERNIAAVAAVLVWIFK